ncbi:hypothetical protein FOY51_24865 [Antrihabitans cavernicola]|uniref:Uncharacterized protein n=1 Tax=Antrihabitans cavernicola TaxID=2495913 RepID=A0A5A7S620_9NOCA|nr:hypothetical protein FOY51_24865 [Spelaeibacter cavernicola]
MVAIVTGLITIAILWSGHAPVGPDDAVNWSQADAEEVAPAMSPHHRGATEQAIRNIERSLNGAGAGLEHVLPADRVPDRHRAPTCRIERQGERLLPHAVPSATLQISALADPQMMIEIETTSAAPH